MTIAIDDLETPLGPMRAAWRDERLCALAFHEHWAAVERALARRLGAAALVAHREGRALRDRLAAYFAGDLAAIHPIPVDPPGTAFQRRVWSALRGIPPGATASYGALAAEIGAPAAGRAVGAATGANPIWLLVPCHRAIGADGSLTGYAAGLDRKRWLLRHEGARPQASSKSSSDGVRVQCQ